MAAKAAKGRRLAKGFSLPKAGKKTKVEEATAEAFIKGEAEASAKSAPEPKPAETRPKLEVVKQPAAPAEMPAPKPAPKVAESSATSSKLRRATRGERVAAYLPPELAEALRIRCARDRRSVSDAVTVAVERWLKEA